MTPRDRSGFPHATWRAVHVSPRPFRTATLEAPASKAGSLRALFLAALAPSSSRVEGVLTCDDTTAMRRGLAQLGAGFEAVGSRSWRVRPLGDSRHWPAPRVLDAGESGVSARFLLALAALASGPIVVRGRASLRRRPVGPLVRSLGSLGARVEFLGREGFLPVRVRGPLRGGHVRVPMDRSSQFASALLAVAARTPRGIRITPRGRVVSLPYLDLTRRMLEARGVAVRHSADGGLAVVPGLLAPVRARVGADPSAAAFGWAAAAIAGGRVRVRGDFLTMPEGDLAMLDHLEEAGCRVERGPHGVAVTGPVLRGIRADLSDHPDLGPPLAAVLAHAPGPSRLIGLAHLRAKESDRVASVTTEWSRAGFAVREGASTLSFGGGGSARIRRHVAPVAYARGDHRIVMALSVLALAPGGTGLIVRAPHHVAKTAPRFFEWIAPLARVRGIP